MYVMITVCYGLQAFRNVCRNVFLISFFCVGHVNDSRVGTLCMANMSQCVMVKLLGLWFTVTFALPVMQNR